MSIVTRGFAEPKTLILRGFGEAMLRLLFSYRGERDVPEPMPEIEGWTPEEPYPAMVVPEQFWTLHLKEAWKVAGDRPSRFTWGPASESVAGICGEKEVVNYIEPPCYYEGEVDFYVRRELAPYVRYAMIGVMMERITQAFHKLDKGHPDEAVKIIEDCERSLDVMSNSFRREDVIIIWTLSIIPDLRRYIVRVDVWGLR